jgi:hypothetical protein
LILLKYILRDKKRFKKNNQDGVLLFLKYPLCFDFGILITHSQKQNFHVKGPYIIGLW